MKTRLHDNNWTLFIDEDICRLSDEKIKDVCKLTVSNMVVVFKNQNLDLKDQIRICSVIGKIQLLSEQLSVDPRFPTVARVTGKKDSKGKEGLFGHTYALDWHANQPSNKDRKPLIWLYGAEHTVGSRTSWINNIVSYENLDSDLKKEIDNIELYCGYKQGSYSYSEYFKEHVNKDNPIRLVQKNKENKKGLFFPFLQIFGFKDRDESYFNDIMTKLKNHVLKEEFCYHHDWEDNDLVISEQWLSIHKRWPYEHMDKRVLHRIAFDYSNVYNKIINV